MKRQLKKFMVLLLTLTMFLSTFTLGAFADPNQALEKTVLESAQLYGDIDISSNELVTVIVELREESIVEAKHIGKQQDRENLAKARNNVVKVVQDKVKDAKVNREYDYLFSGFSVELPSNEVLQLLTVPGIKAVYPNVTYTTSQVGEGTVIDKEAYSPMMMNSAPFIGADEAWESGYTGKGVTVAVIDTGVDYTHPDLAHAFDEYKGWDFVDNDNDPQETPIGDPRGEETAHGTHVSGTIAANGELVKGIAPEAKLLGYRVLGPGGSGTSEDVIAGIERAVEDGADIMNLSLGNSLNAPDWATSIALDWAMAEGVVAVTSNGNSGSANWTVGSPGASRRAISVGASELPYNAYTASIATAEVSEYTSAKVMGYGADKNGAVDEELLKSFNGSYEFVYVGLGAKEDFADKDVEGKIALISRGAYPFVEKAENAKAAGAIGAIIFNHLDGDIPFVIKSMAIPTIKLTNEDGQKMLDELEAGNNLVNVNIEFSHEVDETIADFSSRGPAMDTWMIKPDVSAPGVNIVSTIPTHNPDDPHGYASYQGTSMASPHVAGTAALILEANPQWGVEEVKASLMNTAENLYDPDGNIYPHNSQGAGSIRVPQAINTETLVLPGSHSFGVFDKDNGKQVEEQSFTIKNLSNESKKYSFDVEFTGNPKGIKVMLSNNLKVNAGMTQQVQFNVQVDASKLDPGYYEGTIKVSDGEETIEVPTILFVGIPDYPRVSLGGIDPVEDEYIIYTYLPGGAEFFQVWIYSDSPWGYVGDAITLTNLDAGYYEFEWDGTINGEKLAPGDYHSFFYAEKSGVEEYIYGGTFTVE